MRSIELLAPAKDKETAIAAVLAGCDALFIGGPAFGARFDAANSFTDLKEICEFAHRFNVKVHLTLNTLLYDEELNKAQEILNEAGKCGVDAVIFQDPAVLQLDIPQGVELHASTQCDISTKEKLKFYENLSVSQAVLARELSLKEIRAFHDYCPKIRLEAFVAGALCVGQSGICYISEFMTGRSANRGQCAHICRLPMDLYDKENKPVAHGHLLSMKDNFAGNDLKDLIDAGVSSFKIEGRLKDRDYVVNMTAKFRELLDKIIADSDGELCRSSNGECRRNFVPDERRTFNRGFTDNLLYGNNDDLVNIKSPKFEGMPIGKVISVNSKGQNTKLLVKPFKNFKIVNGDGFTYFKSGELTGFRCNKASDSNGNVLIEVHGKADIPTNLVLKRNIDTAFIKSLHAKDAVERYMKLKGKLYLENKGENCKLILCYADELERSGKAECSFKSVLGSMALDPKNISDKLKKCADSYLKVESIDFVFDDFNLLTLPISAVNELRRQAQNDYLSKIGKVNPDYKFTLPHPLPRYPYAIDERLVLNNRAKAFYSQLSANDSKLKNIVKQSVMTSRNCLIRNHCLCSKEGGKTSGYTLVIGKHRFKIVCDCVACKMHLIAL